MFRSRTTRAIAGHAHALFRVAAWGALACAAGVCSAQTGAAAPSAAVSPTPAAAPARPSVAVTFVVPAPEGSASDRIARIVAKALAGVLESPVQVKNLPGVEGVTGTNAIARADRDGRTLGLGVGSAMVGGKLLSRVAEYNPLDSFDWLAILGTYANAVVIHQNHSAKTFAQWIAAARASPRPLRYATVGLATTGHIAGEFLHVAQHANLVHVSMPVTAQAYAALANGEIDMLFDSVPAARTAAKSGPFRIVAVTTQSRDPLLPDVPAFGESWRDQQFYAWVGIIAPDHLPADVRSRLAAAVGVVAADPRVVSALRDAGLGWLGLAGNDASQFVRDELVRQAKQIGDYSLQRAEPGSRATATSP